MTHHPPHIERLATEIPGAPPTGLTVAPRNAHDVAAVLAHASEKAMNCQVWGGGTRSGFGDPPPPDIVLSTHLLSRIEHWEPDDLTVVVGAGAKVATVEAELAERRQTMVMPEMPGPSTIGGVIATGASALRRGRLYGTRERILETTVVTGDGRIVRSGGRVVKNVTGYDLSRLHVGAFGSLGVIVSVCLKLWPVPPASATVAVPAPEAAATVSRPLAVLEERGVTRVFVWGTGSEVEALMQRLGGSAETGLAWPSDPTGTWRWSIRVPPSNLSEAIRRLPDDWDYLAIHGVGEIRAASPGAGAAAELRSWAESVGGHLVRVSAPGGGDGIDPWGRPPPALDLQRELIAQFDPVRIINPGRLPGGL